MRLHAAGRPIHDPRSAHLNPDDVIVIECVDPLNPTQSATVWQHVHRLAPEHDIEVRDRCGQLRFSAPER